MGPDNPQRVPTVCIWSLRMQNYSSGINWESIRMIADDPIYITDPRFY